MADHPILFSAPMVRAILDGRKTQTRRIVKLTDSGRVKAAGKSMNWHLDDPDAVKACPYGAPGDRLWCRETFAEFPSDGDYIYRATTEPELAARLKWKPSIFMPRAACRITLEITGVRVERVQAITEADAVAEGVEAYHRASEDGEPGCTVPARDRYAALWDSINLRRGGSWASNPWVWVVEFRRLP